MSTETISFFRINRAPALAAAFVICLTLAPNTLASATNTANPNRSGIAPSPELHENGEVLSHEDETLYRAIFEAQSHSYWKEADLMVTHLRDKRLVGHVLADRYERRPTSLPDLQAWLSAYRDLPEANDIFRMAKKLPGAKKAKLTTPMVVSDMVSGAGYGYGTATGFRNKEGAGGLALSLPARSAIIHIQTTLRQGEPAKAKLLLETALQKGLLTQAALIPLQSRLAASFFYNGNHDEARRLTEVSYMQDDARALWINGLSQYQEGDYAKASTALVALANRDDLTDGDHAAAAFWAYRTLKQAGYNTESSRWLKEAANEPRSFYGLLASNLSGQSAEGAWSWHLPEFNKRATDILAGLPAGARALALVQVGQNELAEAELRRINPQGHHPLQEAMLALAEKGHMASLAMKLGGLATNDAGKPYDAALYPVPPWQPKEGFRVDRALMYALIRHESHFDPMAVSSQGACGLMQLMPATAERMSGKGAHSHSTECPDQFFDPSINLSLGQNYVRHLADQPMISDNLLLLLTAYNGGPGRLSQRSGTEVTDDPLLFMESLPAQETHDYVQQVLIQYWTYRARLHQPLQSLAQLAHGEWPRFALRDIGGIREASATPASFAVASNTTIH